MEQYIEFLSNNWELATTFMVLLMVFLWNEGRISGVLVTPAELGTMVNRQNALVVDLRDKKDFEEGHIAGSMNVSLTTLKESLPELESDKDRPLIFVCKMGQYSGEGVKAARTLGYTDLHRLSGGVSAWVSEKLPLIKPKAKNKLSKKQGGKGGKKRKRAQQAVAAEG